MATIEEYICEHLSKPLRLKDGSYVTNEDGQPVTKEEGIAMNVVNQALSGDVKAIEYCNRAKAILQQNAKKVKR